MGSKHMILFLNGNKPNKTNSMADEKCCIFLALDYLNIYFLLA